MKFLKKINVILLAIAIFMGCLAFPEFKDAVVVTLKSIVLILENKKKYEFEILVIGILIEILEAF